MFTIFVCKIPVTSRIHRLVNNNKMMEQVKRNGNIIDRGGFYLKVVFPFPFGSKIKNNKKNKNKKKNESSSGNSSSKVSPRPSASDGSVIKGGVVDNNEWWKKSHRESDSGESSVNSGSIKSSGSSSSSSRCNSRYAPISLFFSLFLFLLYSFGIGP